MGLLRNKKHNQPLRRPQLMEGSEGYRFRRSSTLVGSTSSHISAAAESTARLQSPRLKAHKLRRHRRGIGSMLVISLSIVLGLSWLLSQYITLPAEVRYAQPIARTPASAGYLSAVESYFLARPTERFLFRLNQAALSAYIEKQNPEVGQVIVSQQGIGSFDIEVQLRLPVAVWRSGGREVFVDRQGQVFFKNFFGSPAVTVEDQSGIEAGTGGTVTSNRFISFMGRLVNAVDGQAIGRVQTVIIPTGTTRQIDIKLEGRPYVIKTNVDRTPLSQAADIAAAVRFVDSKNITPQYLDTRIAGKAYYR